MNGFTKKYYNEWCENVKNKEINLIKVITLGKGFYGCNIAVQARSKQNNI